MQQIIAVHPKTPQDETFFVNGEYTLSNKGRRPTTFPNQEGIENTRKKTESITFRLETEIIDTLRREAKRKDITLNTLVSQITKHHIHWYSMAAQAGYISVRKPLLTKLLESQEEEQIKSIAKHVALSTNKDLLLMLRRKYNIYSALDMIETWISISGYPYNHDTEDLDYSNRLHSFVVQHLMGIKWSLYLSELYKTFFEEFGIRTARFDLTDTTLAFEVVVPTQGKEE